MLSNITNVFLFFFKSEYDVSYAQVAGAGDKGSSGGSNSEARSSDSEFCSSYLMTGICEVGDHCTYIHGQFCEMCQLAYLHPYDKEQRRIHREVRYRGCHLFIFTIVPIPN